MPRITLTLEPAVALFYTRIAAATGKTLELVLTEALFKLAGELSLEALQQRNRATLKSHPTGKSDGDCEPEVSLPDS